MANRKLATLKVLFVLSLILPTQMTFVFADPPGQSGSGSAQPPPLRNEILSRIAQAFKNRFYITAMGMIGWIGLPVEQVLPRNVRDRFGRTRVEPWMTNVEEQDFLVADFEEKAQGLKAIYENIDDLPDAFFDRPNGEAKSIGRLKFFPVYGTDRPISDRFVSEGVPAQADLSSYIRSWNSYYFVSRDVVYRALEVLILGKSAGDIPIAPDRLVDIALAQILVSPTAGEYFISPVLREFLTQEMGEYHRKRWLSFREIAERDGIKAQKYYRLEPLFHIIEMMELITIQHEERPNAHIQNSERLFGSLAWIGRGWIANLQGNLTRTLNPPRTRNLEQYVYGRPLPLNKGEVINLAKAMNIALLTASSGEHRTELNQVMMTVTSRIESVIAGLVSRFTDILKLETPKFMQRLFWLSTFSYSVGSFFAVFPPGMMVMDSVIQGMDLGETLRIMGRMGFYNVWLYLQTGFEALIQPWNHVGLISGAGLTGAIGASVLLMFDLANNLLRMEKKNRTIHMREEIEDFVTVTRAGFKSRLCQMGFMALHPRGSR